MKSQRFCHAERSEAFKSESQNESEKQLEPKFLSSDLLILASCLYEASTDSVKAFAGESSLKTQKN